MIFRALNIYFAVWFLMCFVPGLLPAQVSEPSTVEAHFTKDKIKLDGMPDEPCWQRAQRIVNFTQRELHNGSPATERTETAVVYNENSIYIAAWCYDSDPSGIVAKSLKRDFSYWVDDNFEVVFDTYNNDVDGYVFVVNPNGAMADVMVSGNGTYFNQDWNGIWSAAAVINSEGWFAEFEIPFSTLKYPDRIDQNWGVNFERNIRRKQEAVFWQGWSRDYDFEHVSHAGTMLGLRGISGSETLELKPFAAVGNSATSGEKPEQTSKFGFDANYLVTPTLKLNMTVNTDFAQVESDRAQVQLSRYSLYFPEKREFFLEGNSEFDFPLFDNGNVFYSRRIGIDNSREVPIAGGVRLLGRAGRTIIGALSLQTKELDSLPSANYSVVRVKEEVFEKSYIGGIVTAKNAGGHYNYVYGADFKYVTSEFFGTQKNLNIAGSIAQSITDGNSDKKNLAYRCQLLYPNEDIRAEAFFGTIQDGFNPEIGFLRRKNMRMFSGNFRYRLRNDIVPGVRYFDIKPIDFAYYWKENSPELEFADFNWALISLATNGGDAFNAAIHRSFELVGDTSYIANDKIQVLPDKYWQTQYRLTFDTFEGRNWVGNFALSYQDFYGGNMKSIYSSMKYYFSKHFTASAEMEVNQIHIRQQKVEILNVGAWADYAFTTTLSSGVFGQWNNSDQKAVMNLRVHWIPIPGGDVYFVMNQTYSANGIFKLDNTVVYAKAVWRFGL